MSVCLSVCLAVCLNGEPEPGIAVEALSQEECCKVVEEGMSDEEGRFRIRGLQVGLSVSLSVRLSGFVSDVCACVCVRACMGACVYVCVLS